MNTDIDFQYEKAKITESATCLSEWAQEQASNMVLATHNLQQKTRTIAYLPADLSTPESLPIRKRRGGNLLNLDRILLYSPPFALSWNTFFGTVRQSLTLDPKLRELTICYIGILNKAEYEVDQHLPVYLELGCEMSVIEELRTGLTSSLTLIEAKTLALASQITKWPAVVDQQLVWELKEILGGYEQIVEIVAVIASYNCCSRFLTAFEITREGEQTN